MACSHHVSATAVSAAQPLARAGEFESTAAKAKEVRTRMKPHGMRDTVHVDPEHVWGDEGPLNE